MSASPSQSTVAEIRQSLRRGGIVGGVFGLLVALAGIGIAVSPALWFGTARTEGTVIQLEPAVELIPHGSPQAGDMVWYEEVMVSYPVVEYQAGDQKYTFRPRSTFRSYGLGQKIPLLYKMDRPRVVRIDTFADRWFGPLLVGGGLLFLGMLIIVGAALTERMFVRIETALGKERSG